MNATVWLTLSLLSVFGDLRLVGDVLRLGDRVLLQVDDDLCRGEGDLLPLVPLGGLLLFQSLSLALTTLDLTPPSLLLLRLLESLDFLGDIFF